MSSKSTISISFKVEDGAKGLKALTIDAEGLSKALRSNLTEAERMKASMAIRRQPKARRTSRLE